MTRSQDYKATILIVEDERALSLALAAMVREAGGDPVQVSSLAQARAALSEHLAGVILDIGLPDGNGLSLLDGYATPLPTLVITAHGQIENAIAARKLGVREFFEKPIDFPSFRLCLEEIVKEQEAKTSGKTSMKQAQAGAPSDFIGESDAIRKVIRLIAQCCAHTDNVIVRGETGTGKSKVCEIIARESSGSDTVVAWESKTDIGIYKDRVLVIDPITQLTLEDQQRLLCTLSDPSANGPSRIIASAPVELLQMVEQNGALLPELYYRLQVVDMKLPALRERPSDIPELAAYFLKGLAQDLPSLSPHYVKALTDYDWPGNLHELHNVIRFSNSSRSGRTTLLPEHLPELLGANASDTDCQGSPHGEGDADTQLVEALENWLGPTEDFSTYREISSNLERMLILRLLQRFDNKLAPMAAALSANRATLRNRMKSKISPDDLGS